MLETLALTQELIRCPSITPLDAGCQTILAKRLQAAGFTIQHLRFGNVDNLWARYGSQEPLVVFAGHTDVVPPGALDTWQSPPFEPTVRDGFLYGRGACDMKSGLAAMIIAATHFVRQHPTFNGSIGFLITSDEEGAAIDGTQQVINWLNQQKIQIQYCIVGEATSENTVGDTLKIGRRGSLHGKLTLAGKQGHIAYPERAINPIHQSFAALQELVDTVWDSGNHAFPPTSLQLSAIQAGTGADNVIPGHMTAAFNFRFSTAVTPDELKSRVTAILKAHRLTFDIRWHLSGSPFLTAQGKLLHASTQAIEKLLGHPPQLSTSGGTSDGRFIAPTGAEVIELGPCNTSAHQTNEYTAIEALGTLRKLYQTILEQLLLIA